jgi:hypothetical protein
MGTNQLPAAVAIATANRLSRAVKRAKRYAASHAAKIDRRDPVAVGNDEAREVERYLNR